MPLKEHRPTTPSQRFFIKNERATSSAKPLKRLVKRWHSAKGRNCYGRITSFCRGGGHRRLYREIDFMRDKVGVPAKVTSIEYDPNRSANIALLTYADGEKRYILAPQGVIVGQTFQTASSKVDDYWVGTSVPLKDVPPGTFLHSVELHPGKGAQLARSAGASVQLMAVDGDQATLKMPSGEIRLVHSRCRATVGVVGNTDHSNVSLGKAGRNRWKGRRPKVRGVAMNPVDHPMGGGEGRTSGGGHPCSPWGQLSKGYPTRKKSKVSNTQILVRRNGKKFKKG